MTSLPPTALPIPAICVPISQNESIREVSNTKYLSIEESGETQINETVKQSLRDKVLGDNKRVLRHCLELNGIYPEKAPSVSDALTETRVIGQIKIEELSLVQDTCIRHKDPIASPSGSDTSYYETSDTSDCSTDTKTAILTSDTVYRHSSNEYSDISPPSSPCEPSKMKAKLDLQHVSVKLERLPPPPIIYFQHLYLYTVP